MIEIAVRLASLAVCVGLVSPTVGAAQSQAVVVSGVTVIDGTGAAPQVGMTVVISAGRVAALHHGREDVPGARQIDGHGKFLIPGLWDMHVHLAKAGVDALPVLVANGVTGVRDMGGDPALVGAWRSEIDRGERLGPRITWAGPLLESPARFERMQRRGTVEPVQSFRLAVPNATSARVAVDSLVSLGVDFIKVRTVESAETYRGIVAAAARHNLPVVGHSMGFPLETLMEAGQRSIEHVLQPTLQKRSRSQRAQLISDMTARRIAVVPTAVNYHSSFALSHRELAAIVRDSPGTQDPRRRFVRGYLLEDWSEQLRERPRGVRGWLYDRLVRRGYRDALRDYREMHRAGVLILPGTDLAVLGIYPGFSLHDELRHFVNDIGMTPLDALLSATSQAAEFLGLDDTLGTITVGKVADLVLLDADPLADIANVSRIRGVFVNGVYLDRPALDSLLHAAAAGSAAGVF